MKAIVFAAVFVVLGTANAASGRGDDTHAHGFLPQNMQTIKDAMYEFEHVKASAKGSHVSTGEGSMIQSTATVVQPIDDDGDQFEHGDMEANARAEDPSDYSVHQFLAHDDGREGSDASGDSDDGAAEEIARNKAMAAEDHFDSEDTPDADSLVQKSKKSRRQPIEDAMDEFEHGDIEANARAEDPSDYSVHQFLAHDDGREGSDASGDSDDGAAAEIARNKAMSAEDHFDSEDTPDSGSLVQESKKQTTHRDGQSILDGMAEFERA